MPGAHLVSSLLKRWTAGTLHYRVSARLLPYYLDEFTFRFNRRRSKAEACSSTACSSRPSTPTRTRCSNSLAEIDRDCTQAEMQATYSNPFGNEANQFERQDGTD